MLDSLFTLPLSLVFPHRRAVPALLGVDSAADVPCGQREEHAVDAVKHKTQFWQRSSCTKTFRPLNISPQKKQDELVLVEDHGHVGVDIATGETQPRRCQTFGGVLWQRLKYHCKRI